MKKTAVALMLFTTMAVSAPVFASEPSLHEVYQAANGGKMEDAQRMMKNVLQAHPNSGKAHYVEAELLAKQGSLKQAASELETAEKLSPGLSFATPQAVLRLKETISHQSSSVMTSAQAQHIPSIAPSKHEESRFPWGMLFIGFGLIAFIAWAVTFMSRRSELGNNGLSQPGFGGYHPAYPTGPSGGASQVYGSSGTPAQASGPGLGSQILGGLATGTAVGAGVVAGEALMHHFMDGNKAVPTNDRAFSNFDSIPDLPSTPLNDMGGNDFGIADTSSWDDGGSGNSDWN
ncbi:MAG: tetratricopeptide repeat protein [Azonexaceae bacterium]|nr:tetratricopeptide repeat protein [Azonexaceae bacterium]